MAKRGEKASLLALVALTAAVVLAAPVASVVPSTYTTDMQKDVRAIVENNKAVAAGLIRLLFHDCFVWGCDGSVLLEETAFNKKGETEMNAGSNIGLRGLEVIDKIKNDLGPKHSITCTDAVIYAAREATFILSNGKITYTVSGPGRIDGVVSSVADPERFLPGTTFNFAALVKNFQDKKFTPKELVILSGAHGIGQSHLSSFGDRGTKGVDEGKIDKKYAKAVENQANADPNKVFKNNIRDMKFPNPIFGGLLGPLVDSGRPNYDSTGVNMSAVGVLDNSYYTANLQNMVPFNSDWELTTETTAKGLLEKYKADPKDFNTDFGNAMAKLSELAAEGTRREIGSRVDCRRTNSMDKKSYEP